MDVNESNQPANPVEASAQSIQDPVNNQRGNFPIILGVLVLLIVVGGGAYYLGTQHSTIAPQTQNTNAQPTTSPQNNTVSNPTDVPMVTQSPQTDNTADWNTYNSTKLGFTIKYPKKVSKYNETWQYEEFNIIGGTNTIVGFGTPSSKSGGYIWDVSVYTDKTVEQIIKEQGQQFSDRKESRKNITVNGKPALLVTVTTNSIPDWISKIVLIEQGGKVFVIGNGAVEIPEFENFYNSFKLSN